MDIKKVASLLFVAFLFGVAACSPAVDSGENGLSPTEFDESAGGNVGALSVEGTEDETPILVDNPDVQYFAEDMGISLEEAARRLSYQQTIGSIQPQLMADLADSFGGLWVEHEPAYRIVIALTDGDKSTVEQYIQGFEWATFVEVINVEHTLAQLSADQAAVSGAAQEINVPVSSAVDVMNNRVEVTIGNPALFEEELAEAGFELPETVDLVAVDPGSELPDSNRGDVLQAADKDGRTIYLPRQAPSNISMAALMEGTLIEVDGCLRISDDSYPNGFMVIWRHDAGLRFSGEAIEVVNGRGDVIARAGEAITAGGGALESPRAGQQLQENIPGLPVDTCPGPYWVIAEMETLER